MVEKVVNLALRLTSWTLIEQASNITQFQFTVTQHNQDRSSELVLDSLLQPGHSLYFPAYDLKLPIWDAKDNSATLLGNHLSSALNAPPNELLNTTFHAIITDEPFAIDGLHSKPIYIEELDIAKVIFLLKRYPYLKNEKSPLKVVYQSDTLFFKPVPSKFLTPTLPAHVIASIPLLEDLGVVSRICNPDNPGCYEKDAKDLITLWV